MPLLARLLPVSSRLMLRVLLLALCSCLAGCSPSPPTLKPKSVLVKSITAAGLELELTLEAKNPNSITLETRKVTARATLGESVELGEVTVDRKVKIPADGSTDLVVPMTFSWGSLVEIGLLAARREVIPFTVAGKAEVGSKSFHVEVPFTIEGSLTRAQLAIITARSLPKLPF